MNIQPANNVIAAAVAAVITPIALHVLTSYGITLPADASNALPGAIAVIVAHVWDCWSGDNKPKA